MNKSLDFMKLNKKIWHVSGWNYPIKLSRKNKDKIYLSKHMFCWGWGTYKNYWKKVNLNSKYFIKKFDDKKIKEFNFDGKLSIWSQIIRNDLSQISTWAVFWSATIFLNKGLCITPLFSYTKNIGFDNKATHSINKINQNKKLNFNDKFDFSTSKKINEYYQNQVYHYLSSSEKNSLLQLMISKISRIFKIFKVK